MRTEPCENCGTRVMVAPRGWDERRVLWHQVGTVGAQGSAWVEHTPRDCSSMRAAAREAS